MMSFALSYVEQSFISVICYYAQAFVCVRGVFVVVVVVVFIVVVVVVVFVVLFLFLL